jgi:hypothetical protein
LILLAFASDSLDLMMVLLFLMAAQSSFFMPLKYGSRVRPWAATWQLSARTPAMTLNYPLQHNKQSDENVILLAWRAHNEAVAHHTNNFGSRYNSWQFACFGGVQRVTYPRSSEQCRRLAARRRATARYPLRECHGPALAITRAVWRHSSNTYEQFT